MECLPEGIQEFIGMGTWARSDFRSFLTKDRTLRDGGIYSVLVEEVHYIGSSHNFDFRLGVHTEQIGFNRANDEFAQRKWFYTLCKESNNKPEYAYLAVNRHPEEGKWLEVLETILISLFKVFQRGSRGPTSMSRQVGIANAIRPAGLKEPDWEAGNASLPVCMGYNPSFTEMVKQDVRKRWEAINAFITSQNSPAPAALMSEALAQAAERSKSDLVSYVWCEPCQQPISKNRWNSGHQTNAKHQANLPEDQRTGVRTRHCDVCDEDMSFDAWPKHQKRASHQDRLAPEDRADNTFIDCACGRRVTKADYHNHERTKGHRDYCAKAGLEVKVGYGKKWCEICGDDFPKKNFNTAHLNSKHHKTCWGAFEKEQVERAKET